MENRAIEGTRHFAFSSTIDGWTICCFVKTVRINHDGILLIARNDEGLRCVKFDVDNTTIEVIVDNPTLPPHMPRKVNLKAAQHFFDEIRSNLETILLTGTYTSVTPNEDRTIFEIE